MKKIIAFLLAITMCLSLCACGAGNDTDNTTENNNAETIDKSDEFIGEWKAGEWSWGSERGTYYREYHLKLNEDKTAVFYTIAGGGDFKDEEANGVWMYYEEPNYILLFVSDSISLKISETDGKTVMTTPTLQDTYLTFYRPEEYVAPEKPETAQ